jgi:excisionase family DNA binding protein
MNQEFLTIKETACIFSVHQNTIRRAIKKGFLIAIRIGNGPKSPYRISKKSIEAIHHSILKDLAAKVKG